MFDSNIQIIAQIIVIIQVRFFPFTVYMPVELVIEVKYIQCITHTCILYMLICIIYNYTYICMASLILNINVGP